MTNRSVRFVVVGGGRNGYDKGTAAESKQSAGTLGDPNLEMQGSKDDTKHQNDFKADERGNADQASTVGDSCHRLAGVKFMLYVYDRKDSMRDEAISGEGRLWSGG